MRSGSLMSYKESVSQPHRNLPLLPLCGSLSSGAVQDRMSAASGGVRRANKTAFGGLKEPRKQYKRVFTAKDGARR